MSKTECNSFLIKAILHVLKQFSDKKIGRNEKKHGGSVKLILYNLLSTRDYAVFYSVLVYIIKQLFHSLSSFQLIYDSSS